LLYIFLDDETVVWGVRIAIEAPVTVGDMDVAVEPIGIYPRRVTGETMAINAVLRVRVLPLF